MNAITKSLTILSLTATMGKLLHQSDGSDTLKWRGLKLMEAGWEATAKYPAPALDKSKLRQIEKQITKLCPSDKDINVLQRLSFLLLGLIDLRHHTRKKNWSYLDLAIKRTVWCIVALDPKRNMEEVHQVALAEYDHWNGYRE